jgi:hypothetical protein
VKEKKTVLIHVSPEFARALILMRLARPSTIGKRRAKESECLTKS